MKAYFLYTISQVSLTETEVVCAHARQFTTVFARYLMIMQIRDCVLDCLRLRQPIERAETVSACADAIHQSQHALARRRVAYSERKT